ncbi:MAG: transporter substrate-binding domain-containing protein [Desulfobacteraceae bacterium]|nr:transporter substrate-binding domain-containing protein [Desulfobacteraceae bacterium]
MKYSHLFLFIILFYIVSSLFIVPAIADDQDINKKIEISRTNLKLTVAEKSWLQNHQTIRIAGPRSFPPFHYFEKNGTLRGISADYIYMIMNQLGVKVEVQEKLPWLEVLKKAQTKKIDLIPCAARTAERDAYLSFSSPYLSFPLVILTRKDAPFIGGIEDLHGKKLAIIEKNSTIAWLRRDGINFIPYYVNSPLEGLEAVSFGRTDARIENLAAASYLIQRKGLTNVKVAAPTPYGNYDLHMAVRKDWPELLSIINKALAGISAEQHIEIRNKWLSVRYEHGINKPDVIKWFFLIIFFAASILTMVLIWNRRLKNEVSNRKIIEKKLRESEELFDSFMKNLPAYAFIKDASGKYLYVNKAVDFITDSHSKNRIGKTDKEIFPPDVAKKLKANDAEVLKTNKILEVLETVTDKNGDLNTPFVIKFPIIQGEASALIGGIALDLTEQIKAEKDRDNLKTLLNCITDSMPSALIAMDENTIVLHWNKEAENINGIAAEKALNKKIKTLFPGQSELITLMENALEEKTIKKLANHVKHKGENILYEDITMYPITSSNFKGIVVRIDDVTDRVKMEEMIIQSEKMLSVGGLAAGMAHEINNPLAGVLQNVQVILNRVTKDLPANKQAANELGISLDIVTEYMNKRGIIKLLSSVQEAGERAAQIVKNILSFSRKNSSCAPLNDLAQLLDKTIELAENEYNLKQKFDFREIEINREYDAIPKVQCEKSKIQQVFLNILKNGAEAMAEHETNTPDRNAMFTLRIMRDKNMAHIEIEDNGSGIDGKILKRIFEPFFTTKPVGIGTGLGLSVSYFIITENHDGEMSVESTPGSGAKFIIRLPLEGKKA